MRRTLFRKSEEVHLPVRSSVREVLLFDVRDHSDSADLALAERRLGAWSFGPWLLLTGHIVLALSVSLDGATPPSWTTAVRTGLLLAGSLTLDASAGLVVLFWRRLQLQPHTVVRLMCGYLASTGTLWTIA